MDGQVTRCARCGASVPDGRFCTSCGAPLTPSLRDPAGDDTSTHERIPAVPAAPRHAQPAAAAPSLWQPSPRPTVRPTVQPTTQPSAPPDVPASVSTPRATRHAPGPGLWVAAAACLLVVLVLGAVLLMHGLGGSPSSTSAPKLLPPTHARSSAPTTPPTSSATSSAPTSTTTSATTSGAPATDVAGLARASAPRHAPAGVDFGGRPVTYVASNMVDGAADTCWRTPGDATGIVLTFRLDQPTVLTQVGLVNGYAKTVFPGGRRFDWYHGDRRVLAVDWIFDDGTTVSQGFSDTEAMQTMSIDPVTTSTVRLRITRVSRPGRGPAARNDTPISEVSLVGKTA